MQKFSFILIALVSLALMASCGGDNKPAQTEEPAPADSIVEQQFRLEPVKILHIFGGNLSQYYFTRTCTITRLTTMELEAMHIDIKEDYHYYIATVAIEKNSTPFEFPIDDIECLYKVWLVPTMFPDGKFNLHAQMVNYHNMNVAQIDFHDADNLKDLLRKCPHEGDFMVIKGMFEIERVFDHPSNKMDIRGYIKPVAEKKKNKKTAGR